jgi:ribA/ribD-fused uncharacterized protein
MKEINVINNKEIKIIDQFKGEYRWLSNFWPCQIPFKLCLEYAPNMYAYYEYIFPSVEHYYVAKKFKEKFKVDELFLMDAGEAKKYGRINSSYSKEQWDNKKYLVMSEALFKKFDPTLNPILNTKLLETGNAELIEGNTWNDTYWGVDLETGKGKNMLGKTLSTVRKHYKKKKEDEERERNRKRNKK